MHFITYNYEKYFAIFIIILFISCFLCFSIKEFISLRKQGRTSFLDSIIWGIGMAIFLSLIIDGPLWYFIIKKYCNELYVEKIVVKEGRLVNIKERLQGKLYDANNNETAINTEKYYIENTTDSALMITPHIYKRDFFTDHSKKDLPDTIFINPHSLCETDQFIEYYFSVPTSHFTLSNKNDSTVTIWCLENDTKKNTK